MPESQPQDRVRARCGCRIDLAGGTLDIWPLGLLHSGGRTVNLAIDVPVEVELERRSSGFLVSVENRDWQTDNLESLLGEADTSLVAVIGLAVDLPPTTIRLSSASPRGGGLGASSAIGAALIGASERLMGIAARPPMQRALLARDLEARLMGYPTGLQDHLPPMLGGALEIGYPPGGEVVRRLDVDLDALGRSLTIAYSGRSHFSGATNWQVVRRRVEGDPGTVDLFERICQAAIELVPALEAGDFETVGKLVGEEWSARRQLADGVSTSEIESILAAAMAAGAWGGKAGGAGGGGCVVVLHPAGRGPAVAAAVEAAGGAVLEAPPSAEGLQLETF